jgi:hypothetical protein
MCQSAISSRKVGRPSSRSVKPQHQRLRLKSSRHPQRTPEGLALDCCFDAVPSGMNPPATAGERSRRIRNNLALPRDNPQKCGALDARTAAEARSCIHSLLPQNARRLLRRSLPVNPRRGLAVPFDQSSSRIGCAIGFNPRRGLNLAGCRCGRRSAWPRGGRSDPPCRWPARAGSRERAREPP